MPDTLESLRWDNTYSRLPESFYQRVSPTPLPDPYLVAFNPDAADLIGLSPSEGDRPEFLEFLNGTRKLAGTDPIAAIYAGHQFGVWVPQLGDGRAILMGEVVNQRREHWDVQFKGSGLTRFSRMGDGRAVLRSTVREYLGGEAMHGLGIPTTRSLAIIGSEAPVFREHVESAAVLVRLARCHVRFGTFELFASRQMRAEVESLADYVIENHYSHHLVLPATERYAAWFLEVTERTAHLMAQWTLVGFAHGVMNTDNMSILGSTLDYGPFGWLDVYDRGFICNHTDTVGRYAFDQQPVVGLWNCARLAEALFPLVSEADAYSALDAYRTVYGRVADEGMRAKLGLTTTEAEDLQLSSALFSVLQDGTADYTRFFRALCRYDPAEPSTIAALHAEVSKPEPLDEWLSHYAARLARDTSSQADRSRSMLGVNPRFVLRNWIAQDVITNAQHRNYGPIEAVRNVLRTPFEEHPEAEDLAARPPEWAKELSVSCSS